MMTERARSVVLGALAFGIIAFGAAPARAQTAAAPPPVDAQPANALSLRRCLELATRHYPRLQEARANARARRADIDVAHYAPYTDFSVTAVVAPAPRVSGTSQFSQSPDEDAGLDLGVAWRVGIEGMIPLWTFGKITNAWDAVEAGAKAAEHAVQKERNDLRLAVRRAYLAAQAARDSLLVVRDEMASLDRYIPALEQKVASRDADEIDLMKLRMERFELEAREAEVRLQQSKALAALGFLTGLGGKLAVTAEPLSRARHELGPLPRYLTAARLHRPEVNMVRAGILAQEAQVRLQRSGYFPDFGIGVNARYQQTPERPDDRNPYTSGYQDQLGYGAGLVLRYKADFLPQGARVARAEAELEAIRASERFALGSVGVEVEEAFREAETAKRRLDAWTRASELAERWQSQVEQRIEAGTFDEREVLEPTREVARKRFGRLAAILEYNLALAKLAQATGWEQGIVDE
jgi:outer membrane protein TolC